MSRTGTQGSPLGADGKRGASMGSGRRAAAGAPRTASRWSGGVSRTRGGNLHIISALCSITDHRPWSGRRHQAFTGATGNGGRERPAQCGGAAGWAIAEPASGPAQAVTKGNQASKGHRAGCGVYGASGGGESRHAAACCGPESWARAVRWRHAAQLSASNSACFRIVSVAEACLSGG